MFGSGGQDALIADAYQALELPPLNRYLARKLVQRSKVWIAAMSRQMTPGVFEILLDTLECISQIASELPGLESLVIDPIYADDAQLTAHAVRIELGSASMLV